MTWPRTTVQLRTVNSRQGRCRRCGKPIPERLDPRGRPSQWCSGACRAAASRERREREHQAALEQARNQTTLTLRTRPEELTDAARVVREFTAALRTGAQIPITPEHRELIAAMREFSDLIAAQTAPAAPVLNRQQRRARKHTR